MKTKYIPMLFSLLCVAVMTPDSNAAVNGGPDAPSSGTMKEMRGEEGARRLREASEDAMRRGRRGREDGRRHR